MVPISWPPVATWWDSTAVSSWSARSATRSCPYPKSPKDVRDIEASDLEGFEAIVHLA